MGKFARLLGGNLLRVALLLIAVSVVTFALMSLSPVDPVQAYVGAGVSVSPEQRANIAAYWGLDKPPVQRFLAWGSALLRGDFGTSLTYRAPVLEVIGQRAGASFALMGTAWLLSGLIGLGLGIAMGACRGGWLVQRYGLAFLPGLLHGHVSLPRGNFLKCEFPIRYAGRGGNITR